MLLKKIILKIEERELYLIKNVLRDYKENKPEVSISSLRRGSLGDDTLVSFNVDEKDYDGLITKFKAAGINVLIPTSKTDKENIQVNVSLKTIKVQNAGGGINKAAVISGVKTPAQNSPALVLNASIERGEYEKVIQISKDFKSGFDLIKKAKDGVETSVNIAINSAFEKAAKSRFELSASFNQLIKIASDKNLKAMNLINYQKTAGFNAIKLCAGHTEYLNLLIQICNNNTVPNIVCLKAAVELASMVLNEEDETGDIEYAVRYLNIKWLQIAFDIAAGEVTQGEIEKIKHLITAVRKVRNERN